MLSNGGVVDVTETVGRGRAHWSAGGRSENVKWMSTGVGGEGTRGGKFCVQ